MTFCCYLTLSLSAPAHSSHHWDHHHQAFHFSIHSVSYLIFISNFTNSSICLYYAFITLALSHFMYQVPFWPIASPNNCWLLCASSSASAIVLFEKSTSPTSISSKAPISVVVCVSAYFWVQLSAIDQCHRGVQRFKLDRTVVIIKQRYWTSTPLTTSHLYVSSMALLGLNHSRDKEWLHVMLFSVSERSWFIWGLSFSYQLLYLPIMSHPSIHVMLCMYKFIAFILSVSKCI